MKRVGITGGIGAGKSMVTQWFEEWGAVVMYADLIAKELMTQDSSLKAQIIQTFGKESYFNDGTLNRAFLSREAFEKGRVDELNKLVHPKVFEAFENKVEMERKKGTQMVVREAALLLDRGRPDDLDVVILIDAPKEIRIQRVQDRDDLTKEAVIQRIDKQKSTEDVSAWCDYIIINDSTIEDLKIEAKSIFNTILNHV